ncbi:hypothetical protein AB4874_03770 [Thioclava sp. 15-R06ZXC-3]|uniref:Uncharacterized protein n=1 Tax=Thioclava arctica TaxID=3238301 RepID=A0ABV3TGV9_9RHOB
MNFVCAFFQSNYVGRNGCGADRSCRRSVNCHGQGWGAAIRFDRWLKRAVLAHRDARPVSAQGAGGAGATPLVWFDANAGYLISQKYRREQSFSKALGLPARIVINDRYRDWVEIYPILKTRDLLIKGRWRDGDVILSASLQEPLKEAA